MAQSVEWMKMKQSLRDIVVPEIREAGFKGSFPHFRRESSGKVDLISFLSHGRDGGAFEVGASVIFLNEEYGRTNLCSPRENTPPSKLIWGDGRIRHGLPGNYEGAFYYVDTYRLALRVPDIPGEHFHYTAVTPKNEKYALEHLKANNYELVQKADESTCRKTACEVLRQMGGLLSWFDAMKTFDDLRMWSERQTQG